MKDKLHLYILKKATAVLLGMCIVSSALSGCSNGSKSPTITPGSSILPAPTKSITENKDAQTSKDKIEITGILTYVNTVTYKMHFVDIDSGNEYEVVFTGGTDIKNKYDSILSATTMTLGKIYDVSCNKSGKAVSIYEDKDTWESSGITDLGVSEASMMMTIGATDYKYTSKTVILSNAKRISVAEILSTDKITVRGIGKTVYSVSVDKGHGYVTFTGLDGFIGGFVDVGTVMVYKVTEGMVVTAPEGQYNIQLQKNNLVGTKTVNIKRDQTVTLDFSEFKKEPVKTGGVLFSVNPSDAVMYIDGTQVDYSEVVQLDYGKHSLVLNAHNYDTYKETFTVGSSFEKKVIDMKGATTSNTSAGNSATKQPDLTAGYNVSIKAPEGAAVYVDSVYIGIAPVIFSKSAGKKTITFTKTGCVTKSYTIDIANTSEDLNYSFPEMEKAPEQSSTESTTSESKSTESTKPAESTKSTESSSTKK